MGLDHLLAMIAVGMWAAQLGGRATWLVPMGFVSLMATSAWLASFSAGLPLLELGIASSVLLLGLLVAFAARLSVSVSVSLVGLFAFFHGFAHGLEFPETASPMLYGIGFMMATAMLHGIGMGLGISTRRIHLLSRLAGSMIALTGVYLLANA